MRTWVTRTPLLALVVAASGCGEIDHSDYLVSRAEAECRQYRTCAKGFYESEFRDFDDCVDERADFLEEVDDNLPKACDYDGAEGRRCVSRIGAMSCEEFVEEGGAAACDLVWDCND